MGGIIGLLISVLLLSLLVWQTGLLSPATPQEKQIDSTYTPPQSVNQGHALIDSAAHAKQLLELNSQTTSDYLNQ